MRIHHTRQNLLYVVHRAVYVPPHTMNKTTRIGLVALLLIAWIGIIRTCTRDTQKTSSDQVLDASEPTVVDRPTEIKPLLTRDVAPSDGSKPASGKWHADGDISVMDALVTGYAMLDGEEALPTLGGPKKPSLIIRCTPKKRLEIYVVANMPIRSEDGEAEVQYRFDSNPPTTQHWNLGADHDAIFASRARDLYDHIAKADRMLVRLDALIGAPRIATFDVRGLRQSSGMLTACLKKR